MGDGAEPIEDDELLYRRVVLEYFNGGKGEEPSPEAFSPRTYDKTGISLFRAKYTTPQDVAQNDRGKRYWVAVLRAGNLRANGLQVLPKAEGHPTGHAEIPDLTYENRHEDAAEEAKQLLARKLCLEVLGPLP